MRTCSLSIHSAIVSDLLFSRAWWRASTIINGLKGACIEYSSLRIFFLYIYLPLTAGCRRVFHLAIFFSCATSYIGKFMMTPGAVEGVTVLHCAGVCCIGRTLLVRASEWYGIYISNDHIYPLLTPCSVQTVLTCGGKHCSVSTQ